MWIFLTDAFLSIVAHRDLPDHLLVRARGPEDITRVFPFAEVFEDLKADYRYRAEIRRSVVAKVMAEQAEAVAATNFKGAVKEVDRHDAYMDVWGVMARWGRSQPAPTPQVGTPD